MLKKIIALFMMILMIFALTSCESQSTTIEPVEPQIEQMKAICELAVMDCYYHNVTKFEEKNAEAFLWWKKDKRFWIEYSCIITLGIDVSQVKIEVNDTIVSISLPEAKILGCKVDENSISKESYIVAKDSADIDAEDEIEAIKSAKDEIIKRVSEDTVLFANAEQRAQNLLEEYVKNIGVAAGKEYTIYWK